VPSCLLWRFWRKRNNRSFEDRERLVVELKSLFFNTFYLWVPSFVYPNLLSFHDFLVRFSHSC
jgi:hypothetical protein